MYREDKARFFVAWNQRLGGWTSDPFPLGQLCQISSCFLPLKPPLKRARPVVASILAHKRLGPLWGRLRAFGSMPQKNGLCPPYTYRHIAQGYSVQGESTGLGVKLLNVKVKTSYEWVRRSSWRSKLITQHENLQVDAREEGLFRNHVQFSFIPIWLLQCRTKSSRRRIVTIFKTRSFDH